MVAKRNLLYAVFAVLLAAGTSWATPLAIELGAFTSPTIIDFDGLPDDTPLDTQYVGLGVDFLRSTDAFSPGTPSNAKTDTYAPPQTSPNNVYGGASVLAFSQPQLRVGAYVYKFNGSQYIHAFDGSQNLLLTVAMSTSSPDDPNYDFLGIEASEGISYMAFSDDDLGGGAAWTQGGHVTWWDTLHFESGNIGVIPEPATLGLLGLGLTGLLLRRRRKE